MKKLIYTLTCIVLLVGSVGIFYQITRYDSSNEVKKGKIAKEYYPIFMDIKDGKQEIKTLVFGSDGWNLYYREGYLFVRFGQYVLRYNITENEVDRIVRLGGSYGRPEITSFSQNGRYLISYISSFYGEIPINYFFIDLDRQNIEFLFETYSLEQVKIVLKNKVPIDIQKEINEQMIFIVDDPIIYSTIEEKSLDDNKKIFIFHDKNGNTKEIKNLQYLNGGSRYCFIDDNTIGAIIPTEDNNYELGYYKIVIINAREDEVIQEYFLNEK